MSLEENKDLLRRFWKEVFNGKNLDLVEQLFTSDWTYHGAGGQELQGPEELKGFLGMFFSAFPDMEATLEDVVAEGDRVVTRATGTATHQGELMGLPATGKKIEVSVICISRIRDGRIAEDWELIDLYGMLSQLGAIPSPAGVR